MTFPKTSLYLGTTDSYISRELGKLLQFKYVSHRPPAQVIFSLAGSNHVLIWMNICHFLNTIWYITRKIQSKMLVIPKLWRYTFALKDIVIKKNQIYIKVVKFVMISLSTKLLSSMKSTTIIRLIWIYPDSLILLQFQCDYFQMDKDVSKHLWLNGCHING